MLEAFLPKTCAISRMDRPALRITSIPYERIKRSRGTLSPHAPPVQVVGIFCAYILRITKSLSLSKVLHFIIEPTCCILIFAMCATAQFCPPFSPHAVSSKRRGDPETLSTFCPPFDQLLGSFCPPSKAFGVNYKTRTNRIPGNCLITPLSSIPRRVGSSCAEGIPSLSTRLST
ncbi:hypothetical protein ES703_14049 [subsurface metagenome]